ncbi:nucleotidyltransferase family protein [Nocardioides sp. R1-1]|uniref:nucleotidyltransferase family protein n=1 Tax=Nocardioides sp. R1-1 TaxID=3383502 RepID=UPI0038D13744
MGADALDLLRRLVSAALDAEEGRPVGPARLGEAEPRALLDVVRRHRVPELLGSRAGELGLPAEVTAVLDAMVEGDRQRRLVHALETVRVERLLDTAGIASLVFKGVPLAVLTTGSADARGAGDVDVLVRPADVASAHAVLTRAGWALHERGRVEPGMWAWRHVLRWGHSLTYLGPGVDVDLHWRLDAVPGAQPPAHALLARRTTVEVGGAPVPTLAPVDAFHHLAGHREGWTWLRTLVDLRRLARDPAVFDRELTAPALTSLAAARASVGLPASVPPRVLAALDRVPDAALARVRVTHEGAVGAFGGAGAVRELRHGLASSRGPRDLGQVVMSAVLPAHAALPVRSTTAWGGVPRALALRARRLAGR